MVGILLLLVAIVCEFVDSFLGMMYGTILVPTLILLGYHPTEAIPCILLSQALGGFVASLQHHKLRNITLEYKSEDFKVALLIFSLGTIAVFPGVLVGINVPKLWFNIYIGILCIGMGIIVLSKSNF